MTHYLVTGANRGLGLEFVRQLLARGDSVCACCRVPASADELNALATSSAGERLKIYPLDVADASAIANLSGRLTEDQVKVDVLINNAGVAAEDEAFGHFAVETMERILRINSVAPMLMVQALVPLLERSAVGPKIVCITSGLGSITQAEGLSFGLTYGMSKAALNMGVKMLTSEMKRRKIAILTLHPGWVQTDMGGQNATLEAPVSIKGMLQVIDRLNVRNSGRFLNYAGEELPW